MYAILHSTNYRENFEEFLKIDYPRIPFTNNKGLFDDLVKIGEQLINFHLMAPNFIEGEFKENQIQITRLNNSPIVKRIQYLNDDCLYINNDTFFKGISKNVFEFRIGSYKVCQKWLKRHRGEVLKERGIQEFMKVATIIDKTLEFMSDIDDLINKHGGWDFSFLH
jgi:predicted helicase